MIWLPTNFLFHANHAAPEVIIDAPHPAALSLNLGTPKIIITEELTMKCLRREKVFLTPNPKNVAIVQV